MFFFYLMVKEDKEEPVTKLKEYYKSPPISPIPEIKS